MILAVLDEWNAFDVLHHKKWRAVGRAARVIEPRNRRMIQLGERSLFDSEAVAASRREPRIAKNLDGYMQAEVAAFREIDDAHATFTKHSQNSVRAKFLKWNCF